MKTFNEWLETAPEWIKPKTRDEYVRMDYAYTSAQDDMSKLTLVLMQQSMLRGVETAGGLQAAAFASGLTRNKQSGEA